MQNRQTKRFCGRLYLKRHRALTPEEVLVSERMLLPRLRNRKRGLNPGGSIGFGKDAASSAKAPEEVLISERSKYG